MYESPSLIGLGRAEETIRGNLNQGFDIDTLWLVQEFEFQSDIEIGLGADGSGRQTA